MHKVKEIIVSRGSSYKVSNPIVSIQSSNPELVSRAITSYKLWQITRPGIVIQKKLDNQPLFKVKYHVKQRSGISVFK